MSSKRRRSQSVSLVLLPPALMFSMLSLLAGCGPDDDTSNTSDTPAVVGAVFSTADECKAAHEGNPADPDYLLHPLLYTPAQCDEAMAAAVAEHANNAPKFTSIADCEAQFGPGACGPTPVPVTQQSELVVVAPQPSTVFVEQQSSFMPFMTGYMLGSLSGGHYYPTPVYYPAYSYRSTGDVRPLVASGGYGYTRGATSSTIGYVARNTTALSPVGGPFGPRAVVAPTASGAPPSSTAFRSAVGTLSFSSRGTSSFGSSVAAPSSRGGFGSTGSSFGGSGGNRAFGMGS